MKDNTDQVKLFLQKALANVPADFALSEVKYHIKVAINQIENVEKKREKRQLQFESRKENKVYPQSALQLIDDMILAEKNKIEEIQRRKNSVNDQNNDDLQMLGD